MTIEVAMYWEADKAIDVVRELRKKGYIHGEHFDFKYFPPIYDSYSWDDEYSRQIPRNC